MPKPDARSRPRPAAEQVAEEASVERIDSAHTPRKQPEAPPADEPATERIRVQADQLASHLQVRQKTIDHREAQTNAQVAQLQRDARTARLWLRERVAELDDHEKQLTQQQAEARLTEAHIETQQLREQLTDARRQIEADGRRQRRQLAAEQRRTMNELEQQREAVRRRGDHVDQCRAALVKLRGELGQMHRETLEIRLATEELWAQLSGAAPPAALTRSLGCIRTKLADHYRLAKAELDEQKAELASLRNQMAEQYDKLLARKKELEQWGNARRRELDEQAGRLIAREEQLRSREAELEAQTYRWQAERLAHQHEIRRRRTRQRRPEEAAVPA